MLALCRTHKCVILNGLYWGENDGYCWMCECKTKGFVFPLDTCSFDAKTKSCWTSTWPQLGLNVWWALVLQTGQKLLQLWAFFQQLGLKHALRSLSYYFGNKPLSQLQWLALNAGAEQAWLFTLTAFHSGVQTSYEVLDAPGSLFHWARGGGQFSRGMFLGSRDQGATARLLQSTFASSWCLCSGSERRWELRYTTSSPAASACYAALLR